MPESSRSGNLMSKRDRLARSLGSVGLLRLLWLWRRLVPDRLMVVNYHRILDPKEDFHEDRGLLDATLANFRWQMQLLSEETAVLNTEQAYAFLKGGRSSGRRPQVMITFDDGYVDNFTNAFPILKELGLSAVFFIPTAYVETTRRFWWDRVARLVNAGWRWDGEVAAQENSAQAKRRLYDFLKGLPAEQRDSLLDEGERQKGITRETNERVVMNWEEIKTLVENGREIGAHSHSHRNLARLSPDALKMELSEAKRILEEQLGRAITTMSYPFGGRPDVTDQVKLAVREAGYDMAFSYMGGSKRRGKCNLMDLKRSSVEWRTSRALFRAKLVAPSVFAPRATQRVR